jgi:hypothetical protein
MVNKVTMVTKVLNVCSHAEISSKNIEVLTKKVVETVRSKLKTRSSGKN